MTNDEMLSPLTDSERAAIKRMDELAAEATKASAPVPDWFEEVFVIVDDAIENDPRFVEIELADGRSVSVTWEQYPNKPLGHLFRIGPLYRRKL